MRNRAPFLALVLLPLLCLRPYAEEPQAEQVERDRLLLRENGLSGERIVLRQFFQFRTLTEADRKSLPKYIGQLGHDGFEEREAAQAALLARGPAVRELLEKHRNHPDVEVSRRCRELLDRLDNGPGIELTRAAVRLWTQQDDPQTLPVLLDFLPFAEDPLVVDEVLDGLVQAVKTPVPESLVKELNSPRSERRAAAAYVLGRMKQENVREKVLPLLADRAIEVRFRAAQALLVAKEPKAVTAMIELISPAPMPMLGTVETILFNLAGNDAPQVSSGTGTEADRKQCQAGWAMWWKDNQGKVDLARALKPAEYLGISVIPEMHANKVWECGRDGKPLWELAGLHCPIDAHVLPGQRVLVAELNGNRVTERDRTGKIFWEHKVSTPIACQRLPNGMTWISTNNRFFTVDSAGKELNAYTPENGFFIHSAYRMRNGNVAIVSMAGEIREISPAGKVVRSIPLKVQGSWSGISVTPAGNYLVANLGNNLLQEITPEGKVIWEYNNPGVCYATRLPSGNTLIVNNNGNQGLVEVDRAGKTVWERKVETSLWRGHRR